MSPSTIILAKVESNSSEDPQGRVSISAPNCWDKLDKVLVQGNVPLLKGDIVAVDISSGYQNPFILGVVKPESLPDSSSASYLFRTSNNSVTVKGQIDPVLGVLKIESKSGSNTNYSLQISNNGLSVSWLNGSKIEVASDGSVTINNHLKVTL